MKNKKRFGRIKVHKIKTSFDGGRLTNYAGILPFFKFMQKLNVFNRLEASLSIPVGKNVQYLTSQIISSIVMGIFSGLNRIYKIESFTRDPLVQKLLALSGPIDKDTIIARLKRFTFCQSNELSELNGRFSRKIHRRLGTRHDILDIDSTPCTVYGNQEGSSKGYNPSHPGKKSYHPLLAFLNSTHECLLSWLRPGDSHSANNAAEFLKQAFALLPAGIRSLTVRGDNAFFDDKVLSAIEAAGYRYLIKVKLKNIRKVLSSQSWQSIPGMPGWFMCEFYYQAHEWSHKRRMVAVKQLKQITTEGVLFPMVEYQYFCYVTNIEESPLYLHKFYGDRGESENWIGAIKNQLFAGWLLTNTFWANDALWQCSILAYNLSLWMRILTDRNSWRQEPNTFRLWFVQLAGRLVSSARQTRLKLYSAYHDKEKWSYIDQSIEALQIC